MSVDWTKPVEVVFEATGNVERVEAVRELERLGTKHSMCIYLSGRRVLSASASGEVWGVCRVVARVRNAAAEEDTDNVDRL